MNRIKSALLAGAASVSVGALCLMAVPGTAFADLAQYDASLATELNSYTLSGDGTVFSASSDGNEVALNEDGAVALSEDAHTSEVTGVTTGSGFYAATKVSVDQRDVYSKALACVIKWRKDALSDSRIKVNNSGSWMTVSETLKKMGISQTDYLNPSWSNALERIALQRSIEAADYKIGHKRTDGTKCFTATYNGYSSSSEILAWNPGDITTAIDLWASEKTEYIKYVNRESCGEYGHYLTLIDPAYKAYGFAQGAPSAFGGTFAGEASGSVPGGDTSPTNISGEHWFEVALHIELIEPGWESTLSKEGMVVGQSLTVYIWPDYMDHSYCLLGDVSSEQDGDTVSIGSGNKVTAIKRGSADIDFFCDGSHYISMPIPIRSFSDVDSNIAHSDDIDWLADKKISTGWSGTDGAREFRPYKDVARADMAAFLYRLAGEPAYTAPATSPFKDVNPSIAHYKEICWLAEKGISQGWSVSGGKEFRPYASVARCDMAAFLYRMAGSPSYTVSGSPFIDCNSKTPHYKEVCWLASTGVSAGWDVSGGKEFRSYNNVARADMAAFLHRMKDKGLA